MSELQIVWFLLVGVLLTGYAILDGFDLGVGIWYLLARRRGERAALLRAIGPVWDANEVWLITGGGALFAAFPHVYATVFSGFYLALMLLLFALIFRAVAIEARGKSESPRWRASWDVAFAVGSMLPALLFGVALGNIVHGLPLDETRNYIGTFFGLLNPYSLLIGILGFVMLATHGAIYIAMKTDGALSDRAQRWARWSWVVFIGLFILVDNVTIIARPELIANYRAYPLLWTVPALTLVTMILIGVFNEAERFGNAFVASSLTIVGLMGMVATAIFPNIIPASNDPAMSLTIGNASSSELTLKVMFIVAVVGMPIVLIYTIWIYRVFRGKVSASDEGEGY